MTSAAAAKELLTQAVATSAEDPAYFLRFFLSHWFPSPLPPVHLGYLALITGKVAFLDSYPEAHDFLLRDFNYEPDPRDPEAKPCPVFVKDAEGRICMVRPREHQNIIMPRGFSKTTLTKGAKLYLLVTDGTTFGVFLSATATHAETQLLDIKTELQTNQLLRKAYGNQVPTRSDPQVWTADEIQLLNGATLLAKGRGGQVRGLTFQGKRPNKIVLDDVEDEDSINTADLRNKTLQWFYSAVMPAGQIMDGAVGQEWAQEPLQIINLGTLLGAECLVTSLTQDQTFSTIRFGARVREGEMLWPYKMSEATYLKKRQDYKHVGKLGFFTREFDSLIRVDEEAVFPSTFIYIPTTLGQLVQRSLALDPAISEEAKADEAALVVAGRHAETGALWFLDEWGGVGISPSEKIQALFEYHLKWQTQLNGVEAVAYQAALVHLAREEMMRRKHFFVLTPIRHGNKITKAERIVGTLSPRYKNGYIRHQRPLPKLEGNLLDWPNGRKDFADAASMALNLLGETVGVVMDGVLAPEPALDDYTPLPPALQRVGNYAIAGSRASPLPQFNSRYGGR